MSVKRGQGEGAEPSAPRDPRDMVRATLLEVQSQASILRLPLQHLLPVLVSAGARFIVAHDSGIWSPQPLEIKQRTMSPTKR
jgi:hypothetical protein